MFRSNGSCFVSVFVTKVHNILNSGLNDELGTLIAGEQCYVNCTVENICAVLIHDRIQFCMADCRYRKLKPCQFKIIFTEFVVLLCKLLLTRNWLVATCSVFIHSHDKWQR